GVGRWGGCPRGGSRSRAGAMGVAQGEGPAPALLSSVAFCLRERDPSPGRCLDAGRGLVLQGPDRLGTDCGTARGLYVRAAPVVVARLGAAQSPGADGPPAPTHQPPLAPISAVLKFDLVKLKRAAAT